MRTLHFRRFTNIDVLRRAGRPLLEQFFQHFAPHLPPGAKSLPGPGSGDGQWFSALAGLLLHPEELPGDLNDALFALEEMATAEGQERLEEAARSAGLRLVLPPNATHLDAALHCWLADPALLAKKHNESRMLRLKRFEYFSSGLPPADRAPFAGPSAEALAGLTDGLERWFALNRRGTGAARVDPHLLEGEWWFLIRHGAAFTRAPKIEPGGAGILHFRPQRDDVAVYDPCEDELRVNARLKCERDLYREQFGLWLRGSPDYFKCRQAYTLEPLRLLGPDALRQTGIDTLERVRLREIEIFHDEGPGEFIVLGARDLFENAASGPEAAEPAIPAQGRIASACFDFQFTGADRPRPVRVRPPNILKLGRHCDAHAVNTWLRLARIRVTRGD